MGLCRREEQGAGGTSGRVEGTFHGCFDNLRLAATGKTEVLSSFTCILNIALMRLSEAAGIRCFSLVGPETLQGPEDAPWEPRPAPRPAPSAPSRLARHQYCAISWIHLIGNITNLE